MRILSGSTTSARGKPESTNSKLISVFYAGNYSKRAELGAELFTNVPLNTRHRRLVENLTPITHHNQRTEEASWFASAARVNFCDRLFTLVPPKNAPYLKNVSSQETSSVYAGLGFYESNVYKQTKELKNPGPS